MTGEQSSTAFRVGVVGLGKSRGVTSVAVGLAATLGGDEHPCLLTEMDPYGGDLAALLDAKSSHGLPVLGPLLDEAAFYELPGSDLGEFVVGTWLDGVDCLPSGAAGVEVRHWADLVGTQLGVLAWSAGYKAVVYDGGRWSEANKVVEHVDVVYAVADATTPSGLLRSKREWMALQAQCSGSDGRLVMVLNRLRSDWSASEVADYVVGEDVDASVIALDSGKAFVKVLAQLEAGDWVRARASKGWVSFTRLAEDAADKVGPEESEVVVDPGPLHPEPPMPPPLPPMRNPSPGVSDVGIPPGWGVPGGGGPERSRTALSVVPSPVAPAPGEGEVGEWSTETEVGGSDGSPLVEDERADDVHAWPSPTTGTR